MKIEFAFTFTPWGEALTARTAAGLCALFFADDRAATLEELRAGFPGAELAEVPPFDFTGMPLDLHGTPFQREVWRALMEIPEGTLTTYSAIAQKIGRPRACRAVGSAVGANPVSLVVPCHRVVRASGEIGDYRWGPARKKALIDYELERRVQR